MKNQNIFKTLLLAFCFLLIVSCAKEPMVAVKGITLNKTSLSLKEGEEFTLIPTVTPDNADNKSINWSSDNEAIVTVSSTGVVSALNAGTATVSATTVDQGKKAFCQVNVTEATTAVTGQAAHISCRNAQISGKVILSETMSTDLSFGVLYSTSSGVLIGSATQIQAKVFDSDFNFTVSTQSLEPETTYYYRSYIAQDGLITYGEVKSFKTLAVSSMLQTLDATDINPKDAILNASFNLTDCKYTTVEYGFMVTPEGKQTYVVNSTNLSDNKFSYKDKTLARDTKYSFVAYAILDGCTYKGEPKDFTTKSIQATFTAESSNVSCYSATISGKFKVESEGTFIIKQVMLCYSSTYSTLDDLILFGKKKGLFLGSGGSFSADLFDLDINTQYNYVVVAEVDEIELNTEVKSFKTLQIVASVTAESSNVRYRSATISGKLTVEPDGTFSKSARLYYSNTASTLYALKSNGNMKELTLGSDGSFNAFLFALDMNTQYNYVVVAEVDEIELNTEIKSFSTFMASVTAEPSNVSYHSATISGKLTVDPEDTFSKSVTARLYYRKSNLDDWTIKKLTLSSDGSFSADLSSLKLNTQYNYVVVAEVDEIDFIEFDVKSFSTLTVATTITAEPSNISYHSATISGKFTVESEGSFSKSARLYYSNTASTLEELKFNGKMKELTLGSDGSFNAVLSSLISDTRYNYVIVPVVDYTELPVDVNFFKTQSPPPGSVDLGLDVFWATCNLGASKPEEYGGYYQWAGIKEKSQSSYLYWGNCPYHTGSSGSSGWTKYNTKSSYGTVDNKTILDPEDDAAHVVLGGNWHIPSKYDWESLIKNCTLTRTRVNGVIGLTFTSTKSGYEGNSIFLPLAGDVTYDYSSGDGYYWSSSLYSDDPSSAYYSNLHSVDFGGYPEKVINEVKMKHILGRYSGLSVRPVTR